MTAIAIATTTTTPISPNNTALVETLSATSAIMITITASIPTRNFQALLIQSIYEIFKYDRPIISTALVGAIKPTRPYILW